MAELDGERVKFPKKEQEKVEYNVPTYNKWGALIEIGDEEVATPEMDIENDSTENKENPKKGRQPPIVITMPIADISACNRKLKELLGEEEYLINYSKRQTKVITFNKTAYTKVINELKNDKADFYTYRSREEKQKKIVLKAAPNMKTDDIKECLNRNGANIVDCIPMKGKGANGYSYLITTTKETNIGKLKRTAHVNNLRVKWETYQQKKRWSQCHRCQNFGHGSSYCNNKPRCVKCAGEHLTGDCTMRKSEGSKAKCCNCRGDHPANYSQCPTLIEYLETREKNEPKPRIRETPQPQQRQTERPAALAREGVTYASVTAKGAGNETAELINESKKLNEACNMRKMLQALREINERMKDARRESEKFLILQEVLSKLDD